MQKNNLSGVELVLFFAFKEITCLGLSWFYFFAFKKNNSSGYWFYFFAFKKKITRAGIFLHSNPDTSAGELKLAEVLLGKSKQPANFELQAQDTGLEHFDFALRVAQLLVNPRHLSRMPVLFIHLFIILLFYFKLEATPPL
jgi:hypothetical protein